MKAIEARISGRVQGVSYRAWLQETALRHGLGGWVRNEPDGSVRALIAGDPAAVDAVQRSLRDGPPAARVDDVQVKALSAPPTRGFTIAG